MSELSSRRVRSIYKLVRIGIVYTLVVLGVNKEKGFIDLSKKRVDATPEEREVYDNKYNNAKSLNSIINHISNQTYQRENLTQKTMEELYQMFGFEMLEEYDKGNNLFKLAAKNPEEFQGRFNIPDDLVPIVIKNLRRKLKQQIVKIKAQIDCKCFERAGIDAIKDAFKLAEKTSTADFPINITVQAPPRYIIVCPTLDKEEGMNRINKAMKIIEAELKRQGGEMQIMQKPSEHT